jgi:hypothetical protein
MADAQAAQSGPQVLPRSLAPRLSPALFHKVTITAEALHFISRCRLKVWCECNTDIRVRLLLDDDAGVQVSNIQFSVIIL